MLNELCVSMDMVLMKYLDYGFLNESHVQPTEIDLCVDKKCSIQTGHYDMILV